MKIHDKALAALKAFPPISETGSRASTEATGGAAIEDRVLARVGCG
jgi:hypothetical protein